LYPETYVSGVSTLNTVSMITAAIADNCKLATRLTDADLEKLGVLLGHCKRLLKAIKKLRPPASHSAAFTEIATPSRA
jgi:hypothetical protein